MRIHTYGEYDKDGWKVPNPSALPWEKNNFKGAFELKSANGSFGIRFCMVRFAIIGDGEGGGIDYNIRLYFLEKFFHRLAVAYIRARRHLSPFGQLSLDRKSTRLNSSH